MLSHMCSVEPTGRVSRVSEGRCAWRFVAQAGPPGPRGHQQRGPQHRLPSSADPAERPDHSPAGEARLLSIYVTCGRYWSVWPK
eukprot:scaffold319517_cov43-Prasinocladus_malaysianus.AAC.1